MTVVAPTAPSTGGTDPAWLLHAQQVAAVYRHAETTIIALIRDQLAQDLGAPGWAVARLAEIETVRAHVDSVLQQADTEMTRLAEETLQAAHDAGQAQAITDLEAAGLPTSLPWAVSNAVNLVALDTLAHLWRIRPVALRSATDAYQRIVGQQVGDVILGAASRVDATERALQRFARHGITGLTDRGGRRWRIDSYAEMAMRTGAANALRDGHTLTLAAAGQRFVRVSDHGYTCPLCAPWAGKVLSIDGTPAGTYEVLSAVSDRMVTVRVAGTITEAKAAGLYHPNCAHRHTLVVPGTAPPRSTAASTPPGGYAATQRQREIERHIRRWKRAEAAALTPETRASARARIRQWQAARRELLARYPGLRAKPRREQVKTAH